MCVVEGSKHMGQPDASRVDEHAYGDDEGTPPADTQHVPGGGIEAAASGWMRQGFAVRYRDPYLLQLIRREPPGWREAVLLALAGGAAVAAASLALRAYRQRLWHVVTLVVRPDGRIVTHQIRAPRPPAP
jgi:hypothetical protein